MDEPNKMEHQIELAERIAATVKDEATAERLLGYARGLRQKLQDWQTARRRKRAIRDRAYGLWEQAGRPVGRDEEFWFTAERELDEERESK